MITITLPNKEVILTEANQKKPFIKYLTEISKYPPEQIVIVENLNYFVNLDTFKEAEAKKRVEDTLSKLSGVESQEIEDYFQKKYSPY
jgi:hypothetical protein